MSAGAPLLSFAGLAGEAKSEHRSAPDLAAVLLQAAAHAVPTNQPDV